MKRLLSPLKTCIHFHLFHNQNNEKFASLLLQKMMVTSHYEKGINQNNYVLVFLIEHILQLFQRCLFFVEFRQLIALVLLTSSITYIHIMDSIVMFNKVSIISFIFRHFF